MPVKYSLPTLISTTLTYTPPACAREIPTLRYAAGLLHTSRIGNLPRTGSAVHSTQRDCGNCWPRFDLKFSSFRVFICTRSVCLKPFTAFTVFESLENFETSTPNAAKIYRNRSNIHKNEILRPQNGFIPLQNGAEKCWSPTKCQIFSKRVGKRT